MEEIIDMQIPLLLCAILLIVISIPLYFGKGSNMIAGYNDLSQVDKEKINKLRLCRVLAMIFYKVVCQCGGGAAVCGEIISPCGIVYASGQAR